MWPSYSQCEDVSFPVPVRLSRGNIRLTWSRARFIVSRAMAFSKPGYGLDFHNVAYAAFLLRHLCVKDGYNRKASAKVRWKSYTDNVGR